MCCAIASAGCALSSSRTQCALSSDCADPLVCAGGFCREQCEEDSDCASSATCEDVAGRGVCFAATEAWECEFASDCPAPLVCGASRTCVEQCRTDYDCSVLGRGLRCVVEDGVGACRRLADAGIDAGGEDAGVDAAREDAGTQDSGLDAWSDAGLDAAAEDAGLDAASQDAGADAGQDTGVDAASPDGGPDGGMPPDDAGMPDSGAPDASCPVGTGDCDMTLANGCETVVTTRAHCGGCGIECVGLETCSPTSCVLDQHPMGGGGISCALRSDRSVQCLGRRQYGDLGNGVISLSATSTPADVMITDAVQLSGTRFTVCATRRDRTVYCWGANDSGQLGNGTTAGPNAVPAPVTGISTAERVAVGQFHVCAALSSGNVQCWGDNDRGQLGDGTTSASSRLIPQALVTGLDDAVDVSAGEVSTCALRRDGTVVCWGLGDSGQLGNGMSGATYFSSVPVPVTGLTSVLQISVRGRHACALRSDQTIWCWGSNGSGELGIGSTSPSSTPRQVMNVTTAVEVASGVSHTCARLADGALRCWGRGDQGQMGNGTTTATNTRPVTVSLIDDAAAIVVGAQHGCAQRADDTIWCWGNNSSQQVGVASPVTVATPVQTRL